MEVVGVFEQGIVFGIQIPEKEMGIYFIFLGIKQFEPFLSKIRRKVNPGHKNRKTCQTKNGFGLSGIKPFGQFPFFPPWGILTQSQDKRRV